MRSFQDYLERKRNWDSRFDSSDLAPQFIPFFESGQKIEVTSSCWGTRRGYVGVTTGWKPVFILLARNNCSGSGDVLRHDDRITKTINKFR